LKISQPKYYKKKFNNGLTLISEEHPYARTLSIGLWVKVGSIVESDKNNGVCHFIEHMVFKGTKKRNSLQIATALESLGGDLNAFTDREFTCFHATVLCEHVEIALDVLSDLVFNPSFDKLELERERKVIQRELAAIKDAPEEWMADAFMENIWKNEKHGKSIIGTKKTIGALSQKELIRFYKKHYLPSNMVLSIAGNTQIEHLTNLVEKYFSSSEKPEERTPVSLKSNYHSTRKSYSLPQEQLHFMLGFEGFGFLNPKRIELLFLTFFLGGGMSSRLFQELREKEGLAYHIDCDFVPFTEIGFMAIVASLNPSSLNKTLKIISKEIHKIKQGEIDAEHLEIVKSQLMGTILMNADQMEVRQESLGRNELVFGRYLSVDEVSENIRNVTKEGLVEVANSVFIPEKESIVVVTKNKVPANELSLFR
jgi:predicted Zn-dependent peptidase